MSSLIRLQDGTLVEVEVSEDQAQPVSGDLARKVDAAVDAIQPTLLKICRPLISTWAELNKEVQMDQAEVELGLSFEGEGNLYVTKAKAGANFKVKLVFKSKEG